MPREKREKIERRNKTLVGLVLVVIMVLSVAGYGFLQTGKEDAEKIEYKDIEFILENDGLWHFNFQGKDFSTVNNPKETENIYGFLNLNLQNYMGKPLYFSHDSIRDGMNEIARNIGGFVWRAQLACIGECKEDLPIKNCSDYIIIIKQANETLIKQEENCIYVLARENEIINASDAFIFKILGLN